MSPDQVLGPWDPGWGERAALEGEGRLNGVWGRSPQEFGAHMGPIGGPLGPGAKEQKKSYDGALTFQS